MHEAAGDLPGALVTLHPAHERAFEDRVRDTADLAVRVAYSVLRRREDAEDVAQEAFTRAYRRFALFDDPLRFRAWIVRVVWRLAIDRWRADRRRQAREHIAMAEASAVDPEDLALQADRSGRLWRAIDELPEKLRMVIVLAAIEGHDVQTLARMLAIPEGTVKSRLFLARKKLAERLTCLANDSTRR